MIAIKANSLGKKYKEKIAVDSLSLEVEQGELFALLGVNGAGKTTMIKMLSCLIKPSSGEAFVFGNSIISAPHKVKELINVSPQETAIAPNLTVKENLEFIAGIYGNSKEKSRQMAAAITDSFKMSEIAEDKAKILSGGWQRRLSIAMALISEPQLLFLDEPTLGLDVLARRELWSMIEELKGRVTIILTTHYLEEAVALSDRIGIMSAGRLCEIGTAAELMSKTDTTSFEDAFVSIAGGSNI